MSRLPLNIAKTLLIGGIVAMLVLNCQPWIIVGGGFFQGAIVRIPLIQPFIDGVASIWVVGKQLAGLLLIAIKNGADLGCLLLCALANLSETAPMLLRVWGIEAGAIDAVDAQKPPQGKSLEARLVAFLALLSRVRLCGFLCELAVCGIAYPIYGKGVTDLVADMPNSLDPGLLNFNQIVLSIINLFGFETVLAMVLGLWSGINVISLLTNSRSVPSGAEQRNPRYAR
jgi:hypothetical protein